MSAPQADDGFDLLRLRVSDESLPWTDECRRALDRLLREHAESGSTLREAAQRYVDLCDEVRAHPDEYAPRGLLDRALAAKEHLRAVLRAAAPPTGGTTE